MMKILERQKRITGFTAVLIAVLLFVMPLPGLSFASTNVEVPVSVSFDGNILPEETFTVELRNVDTGRVITGSVKLSDNNRSGEVVLELGDLTEGVHEYDLRQIKGSTEGVIYSSAEFTYYVSVSAGGTIVRRAVDKNDETNKPDSVEFVNRYTGSGSDDGGDRDDDGSEVPDEDKDRKPDQDQDVVPDKDPDQDEDQVTDDEVIGDPPVRVRKDISGQKPQEDVRFTFIMRPEKEGQPLPDVEETGKGAIIDGVAEVYLNGTGEIEIGNITFKEEGVYRYFVSEKEGSAQGYDYDGARFTVTYEVTRGEDGKLYCRRTIKGKTGAEVEACAFDNIYDPNPVRRKIHRIVKTGDPSVMWPLTMLIVAGMILVTITLDKRFRREAGREESKL